jgi:hypothetical protein
MQQQRQLGVDLLLLAVVAPKQIRETHDYSKKHLCGQTLAPQTAVPGGPQQGLTPSPKLWITSFRQSR